MFRVRRPTRLDSFNERFGAYAREKGQACGGCVAFARGSDAHSASRCMNLTQADICSRPTNSSGWCASLVRPGPQTTAGTPASWNNPASDAKETPTHRAPPVSWRARATAGESRLAAKGGTETTCSVTIDTSGVEAHRG